MNPAKSVLVPLARSRDCLDWQDVVPMRRLRFKYLGIWVALLPELSWALNLTPLVSRIRDDLRRWQSLPVNVLARVALYKMTVLPCLLYLIQNLPFAIHRSWFTKLVGIIISFIWGGTRH
ncbi:hypothetical protein NDU88_002511 [Pleurodeles waltl]|uniref:Uncharacterized protein n=1 Tax=Pleurodeles waltl TaxID=8319 RepID=A0AAV7QCV3_PLEWA|nr:hypothetical protein NDU88_002511 [Pleurodeles waltl]